MRWNGRSSASHTQKFHPRWSRALLWEIRQLCATYTILYVSQCGTRSYGMREGHVRTTPHKTHALPLQNLQREQETHGDGHG